MSKDLIDGGPEILYIPNEFPIEPSVVFLKHLSLKIQGLLDR